MSETHAEKRHDTPIITRGRDVLALLDEWQLDHDVKTVLIDNSLKALMGCQAFGLKWLKGVF